MGSDKTDGSAVPAGQPPSSTEASQEPAKKEEASGAGKPQGVKGLGSRLLARRQEMARASLSMCPDLADRVSMDEVMEHVYGVPGQRRRGPGGPPGAGPGGKPQRTPRPGPRRGRRGQAPAQQGPAPPSPDLIAQSVTVFASAHATRYQAQLQEIQDAKRQLEEQEAGLRERCLNEFVQYVAFLLANSGCETELDAVLEACAPPLAVAAVSVRQFKAAVLETLGR